MRNFTEEEKKVINNIVANASHNFHYVLFNTYYDMFNYNKVDYDVRKPNCLLFYVSKDIGNVDPNRIFDIQYKIIIQSRLIKYLVDNGLVYLISNSEKELDNFVNFDKGNLVCIDVPIDDITAEIIKYSMLHYIIVTQDLVNLVNNNYISDDERRHKEQMKNAEAALEEAKKSTKIAIAGLLIAIIIPVILSLTIPLKLNESQYEGILKEIKQTTRSSILNTSETIDYSPMETNNGNFVEEEFDRDTIVEIFVVKNVRSIHVLKQMPID